MVYKAALTKARLAPVVKVGRRKDRQPLRKIGIEQGFQSVKLRVASGFCHIKVIAERLRLCALRQELLVKVGIMPLPALHLLFLSHCAPSNNMQS